MTDRARTCERFAEMRDVALRAPPLTEDEKRAHAAAQAREDARAEARRTPAPQLQLPEVA